MIAYFDFRQIYDAKAPGSLHELSWIYRGLERSSLIDWGTAGVYSRAGRNIMPFAFPELAVDGFSMPTFDPNFSRSWQEITDTQCHWLRQKKFDQPWVIAWSGGIDSTVIVAAVLRNLSRADLDNITIACNKFSIWENPRFYQHHIRPNFKIIDSSMLISSDIVHDPCYVITGEPADRLFGKQDKIPGIASTDVHWPDRNMRRDPDGLIAWLIGSSHSAVDDTMRSDWAHWFYHAMIENIDSQPVPVETYRDFVWWFVFNFTWIDNKIRGARKGPWGQLRDVSAYFDRVIDWFDSDDYQLWSMVNNATGEKYGNTISDNKLAAKRYIFDFDREPYYFKFKTKTSSIDLVDPTSTVPWSVLFQDLTTSRFSDIDRVDLDRLLDDHLDSTVFSKTAK